MRQTVVFLFLIRVNSFGEITHSLNFKNIYNLFKNHFSKISKLFPPLYYSKLLFSYLLA